MENILIFIKTAIIPVNMSDISLQVKWDGQYAYATVHLSGELRERKGEESIEHRFSLLRGDRGERSVYEFTLDKIASVYDVEVSKIEKVRALN